jgi:uncharacterized protein (DUF1697 family)
MDSYVVLLRGINVGGKNKVPMAALKQCLEDLDCENVRTYIQSGNTVLRSRLGAATLSEKLELMLPTRFKLDSQIVKVLALDHGSYKRIVAEAPQDFGKDNKNYRYYVMFLMGIDSGEAIREIDVRQGVDEAWQGEGVIYYRLPSLANPDATRSHLTKISQKPIYKSVTIRNWNTAMKLLDLLEEQDA